MIDKYGIKAICNPETDIESATVDTSFLGQRPLTVKWIKEPVLQFDEGQEAQAEEDGYTFKIKVINGTCEVKDNRDASAADNPANWETYLTKAEKPSKLFWITAKIKMRLDLKIHLLMKTQISGQSLLQPDVVMFHMTIVPILTDGLQILKFICRN